MYGLPGLKTHSKITLFEREVDGQTRREVHLGTGNYHDGTARLYTDFGLLTADPTLTSDAVAFSGGWRAAERRRWRSWSPRPISSHPHCWT